MPRPVARPSKSPKPEPRPASRTSKLNAAALKTTAGARVPLWRGPGGAGPNGGVTQSLLGRFLSDGERFRVQHVEGWNPVPQFSSRMEYGNMWHACEEAHGAGVATDGALGEVVEDLCKRFPTDREEIGLWAEKCWALFNRYVEFWKDHPDEAGRTSLFQEQVFDVPYRLPSGRTVRLRGKWDSVDLINGGVWLDEHKTKSGIDAAALTRQLTFDLQTMLYLVALDKYDLAALIEPKGIEVDLPNPIKGVRYNVVRRPAHKSVESMLKKVDEDCRNGRSGEWFSRFEVRVAPSDVARFKRECLDPVLENLFDDWEWWEDCFRTHGDVWDYKRRELTHPDHARRHFRFPYGVYNPLTEGGTGEVDECINSGSTAGLRRLDALFSELQTKKE